MLATMTCGKSGCSTASSHIAAMWVKVVRKCNLFDLLHRVLTSTFPLGGAKHNALAARVNEP